jgi:hypothetical protein
MSETLQGRRLPDAVFGEPGEGWNYYEGRDGFEAHPGDYLKVDYDGRIEWWIRDPWGRVGRLGNHTVVEHEDGTITVTPSIYDKGGGAPTEAECVELRERYNIPVIVPGPGVDGWHGWLEHGVWRSC